MSVVCSWTAHGVSVADLVCGEVGSVRVALGARAVAAAGAVADAAADAAADAVAASYEEEVAAATGECVAEVGGHGAVARTVAWEHLRAGGSSRSSGHADTTVDGSSAGSY